MKQKMFKKVMATGLAATMVFGGAMTVSAAGATGLEGTGSVDGLVNLDVISVEVPTSAEIANRFDFVLDPQGLIQKSLEAYEADPENTTLKDGVTAAAYPEEKASTMYFANLASAGTGPVEADATITNGTGGSATVAVTEGQEEQVTGKKYIYKTTADKWAKDGTSVTYPTLTNEGWYEYVDDDTTFGTEDHPLISEPTKLDAIPGVTITGAAVRGDVVTTVAAAAATSATYTHSGTSDAIVATNKGFVDTNVSITATLSDLGNTIKTTSLTGTDLAAATTPLIYLAVKGGTQTVPFASEKTQTYLYDKIDANDFDDFLVSYNTDDEVYEVVEDETPFETYSFQLTGATSTKGWVEDLADAAPKVNVVWNFTKKSSASVTVTNAGVVTVSGTSEDLYVTELEIASKEFGRNAMSENEGTYTFTNNTATDGTVVIALGDAWKTCYSKQAITAIVKFNDGTTATATVTMAEFPAS